MAKKHQMKEQEKRRSGRLKVWITSTGVGILALVIAVMIIIDTGKDRIQADDHAEQSDPSQLTGNEEKVRASLISLMASPTGEFIYVYEEDCEQCDRLDSMLYPLAEEKELTLHSFNISENPNLVDLLYLENIKPPAVVYYSRGYKIGWIGGSEEDKYYKEFFDHFHLHDEKHPEGEPEHTGHDH